MRVVTKSQHEERVETVIEVIKDMTGQPFLPGGFREKLNAMSYDELGDFVMQVVKTRSFDDRIL